MCVCVVCVIGALFLQLVYDVQNKTADFILMTLHPDQLSSEDVDQFKKVGIRILSVM